MPTTERVSADLVAQKELFTAPFMMYDGSTRRIIANPRHNRLLLADLARTQATLVHLLRRARPSPVEQLHALQQSLIYVLASTSTSVEADARNTGIISVVCDAELQQHMKRLEEASMHHDMSSRGIAATAHVLSDEVCRTTLANYINAAMETTKEQQQQQQNKNASETQTLGSVLQHLEQCQRSVEEIHASYLDIHTISSSEQQQQQQSLNASSSSVASTKVVKSYYNLLTWALSLDADRRAAIPTNLQTTTTVDITRTSTPQVVAAVPTSATNTNTNTNTSAPASTPADVAMAVAEDYDPFTGKLQLTRASTDCRWGISFSEGGFIVGIHEQLRGANECGQRLHDAIQLKAATGLRVREIQRRRVGKSTTSSSPLTDILAKMKSANDELSLTVMLEKLPHVSRSSAQEVFFGEVGHKDGHPRAMLVLQRLDPHVPWGCAFALDDASRQLHLHDVSATVRLSKAAKTFIHSNKNNVVRVLHINYNDVGHLTNMAQVEGLSKSALMLALQLELTDAPTRAKEEEVAGAEAEEATTTTPMEVDGAPAAVAMDPVEEEEVVAPIEAHGDEEETAAITHKEDVQHTQLQFDDDDVDFDDVMQEIHDDDDAEKDATKEGMEGNDWAKLDADDDAPTSTVLDDDDAGASTPVVEEGDEEEGGKLPHASPVEPSGAIDSIIHDFFNTTPSATTTTALAEEAGAAAEMMSDEKGKRKRGAPKKAAEKPAKRGRRSTKVAKADDGDADVAAAEMEEEASVLPPRASAAELAFAEIQSNKNTTKATTDDAADADNNNTMEVGEEEEEPRRVPLAQLMEAAPLRFNNSICVEKFDGTTIEMTRPGVETPWEMLIAFSGSDILLTRLPPMNAAARKHPFTRALKPDADGRGRWAIDSINGKDLTLLDKRQKAQTLEMLKKSINVRLALRALPK